ncbi:T9SS type A sorting domain-containing protein [Winogradskyella forsetii]|uniref:T9SS type A sorting domain-containing protein n=1 Tax=Winogradskyella forsetii TaxID=2686077 RepID=UPI0015BAE82E|nr:T9SS type A sorting domain-containing protein [Winogradskyella forsetii]
MRIKLRYLTFVLIVCSPLVFAQTTYIPDDNFEQFLIDAGYDDVLDDYVVTANINIVTELIIGNRNISDLTGIEDFTALTDLMCSQNQLFTLDVSQNINLNWLSCNNNLIDGTLDLSQNTALIQFACTNNSIDTVVLPPTATLVNIDFGNNELTSIDTSQNPSLTIIRADNNLLDGTLDLSQNTVLNRIDCQYNSIDQLILPQTDILTDLDCRGNQLTALNVDYNVSLIRLLMSGNEIASINLALHADLERLFAQFNMLTTLDLSNNVVLKYLTAHNNNLNYLSIKNGNNSNFTIEPYFVNNPLLTCIEVDDAIFSTNNWTTYVDPQHYFSEDCSLGTDESNLEAVRIFPNPLTDNLFLSFKTAKSTNYQLINVKGQIQLEGEFNELNETIDLSEISAGVYFLKLQTLHSSTIKKLVKQ